MLMAPGRGGSEMAVLGLLLDLKCWSNTDVENENIFTLEQITTLICELKWTDYKTKLYINIFSISDIVLNHIMLYSKAE